MIASIGAALFLKKNILKKKFQIQNINNPYLGRSFEDEEVEKILKKYKINYLKVSKVENKVVIGPFARIRPGTVLKEGSKIGNFVEIKKSILGKKSKVNHLTYIGDALIGKSVNVGAGTITCNYDGIKKSKTKIKDNVFNGSNSSLVAPLTIQQDSVIGAGSVITKNVSKKSLALTRSSQTEIKNYKRKSR